MKPRYRIVKYVYEDRKACFFVERAVRLLNIHLWWHRVNRNEISSHHDAIWFLEQCCDENFFEYREKWHRENNV